MQRVWLAVMLLFAGCAFGLSGPDPNAPRTKMPRCDTSKGLVALDGVMAATAGVVALGLASADESAAALLPLSIGALYVAGAVNGNGKVNDCRKAMDDYDEYMAARETLPATSEPESRPLAGPVDVPRPSPLAGPIESQRPSPIGVAASPPPVAVAPAPAPVQPVVAPPPVVAAPPPVVAAPAAAAPAPAKKPAAKPQHKAPQDDWSDFWREVE